MNTTTSQQTDTQAQTRVPEPDWGPVFTARPIRTGPDGRHLDAEGREYLAVVIEGETTFVPVGDEWATVPAVVQGDQVSALALGGVRVTPAQVAALVVPVLLSRDGDLLLETDEGLFWPSPAPTGRAPAALAGGGGVSPGQAVDAVHAAVIAEGLTPGLTDFSPYIPEVSVHFGSTRPTADQAGAVLTRLGVAQADVGRGPWRAEGWSTVYAHVPVLGIQVELFIQAAPGSETSADAGGTP